MSQLFSFQSTKDCPKITSLDGVAKMEQLHDFFFKDEAQTESIFAETAPTNTATRLNGGGACRAFYKLPLRNLSGKRGKLSKDVVEVVRKRMQPIRGQVVDEMSMLTPQQNFQIDYRCKQAKLKAHDQ